MPRPFHVEYQPRLMVSVRDAAEAAAALAGGADIIDVVEESKDPSGAAEANTIAAVVQAVNGARPVCAALGDLATASGPSPRAAQVRLGTGLTFVRMGLAQAAADWESRLEAALAPWRPARALVIAYADAARAAAPQIGRIFNWAAERQAGGLFIDTAIKDGKDLFTWMERDTLREWVMQARHRSMLVAVAVGPGPQAIRTTVEAAPDIIAVRGATHVAAVRKLIEEHTESVAWTQ